MSSEVDFRKQIVSYFWKKKRKKKKVFHIMNKNKRENIWATSLRLLRDHVPSKIKALWIRASRKITHGRNKGHRNYARTSCTESHAHTNPADIWFVPVCSACLNLVEIANLVWCVLRVFLGMCLVVSQTNLSFQAGFVCCQQWDHGRAQLWSWQHRGTRPSVPHTQLWDK